MKMNQLGKAIRLTALVLAFFGLTSQLQADTNLVNVTFTGGSIAYSGYYVGPYNFMLNNTVQGNQSVALVCMDFTNEIYGGETWQATISTFDDISLTRNPDSLQTYEEAGWLYDYGVANPSQWGAANYAIWAILAPSQTEANGGWSTAAANLLAEAQAQTFTPGEFSNLAIMTPTTPGPQEFIGVIPGYSEPANAPAGVNAVPEPSSYFGATLAAAGLWTLFKRRGAKA